MGSAWTSVPGCEINFTDVPTLGCLGAVILRVLNAVFFFLGAIVVIYLIFGALKFVVSGGDPKAVTSAKNTMTYAIFGLVIILLSFLVLNFIGNFLGLPTGQLLQFNLIQ